MMQRGLRRIMTEAAVVMVPSQMGIEEFAAQGFERSKLVSVPLGVRLAPEPDGSRRREVLARHSLVEPFVLFVGTAEPRKGLDVLAAAMEKMARQDATLAVVGPEGWGSDESGNPLGVSLDRLGDRVRGLGFVDASDLDVLRSASSVCCLPSRAEGFGLPVLEAMAAGAPVVTTSGTPMAEFASGVADFVSPGDAVGLADALSQVIEDTARAQSMREAGRARAAEYSWERSARGVLDVSERVLGP